MKNFVQFGEVITVAAPVGGAASGDSILIGSIFGVATYSADAGKPVEICTEGVFDLPKKNGDAFSPGDKAYFDATSKEITSVATNNPWVGVATEPSVASAGVVRVMLNEIVI